MQKIVSENASLCGGAPSSKCLLNTSEMQSKSVLASNNYLHFWLVQCGINEKPLTVMDHKQFEYIHKKIYTCVR